jgi:alpha-tubulin suppressor-like RCC1 family protein
MAWCLSAALLVQGCGSSGHHARLGMVDDGASAGEQTSALVTGKQEVVMKLKTGAKVTIPKGAVDKQIKLGLERPKDSRAVALVQSLDKQIKLASAPYVVTPHGTKFKAEVEVTLPITKDSSKEKLSVLWLEDEKDTKWKHLDVPTVESGEAKIKVSHFSVLLLVEGDLSDEDTPKCPVGVTSSDTGDCAAPVTGLAAGNGDICALRDDGTVSCWGYNGEGELGEDTDASFASKPGVVRGLSDAVAIAAQEDHTCAIHKGGTVSCWGSNDNGELGDGTMTDRKVPVAVRGLSGVTALSLGVFHSCALIQDGTVSCWGSNTSGVLGNGGTDSSPVPVAVSGLSDATAVAAGFFHTCALRKGGTTVCWGNYAPFADQSKVPVAVAGASGVSAIATGFYHTCVVLKGGTVSCWGQNDKGQVGDGSTTEPERPVAVSGLSGVTSVTAGESHTCALHEDGTVSCWGDNSVGQLGDGTTSQRTKPVDVSGLADATQIVAGLDHTCALRKNGVVVCWGETAMGQQPEPTPVVWN